MPFCGGQQIMTGRRLTWYELILNGWNFLFQKSQIFKISCSSHSENAHIKLNNFQSWFVGWGGRPLIFLWAGCWDFAEMDPPGLRTQPPKLFIHPRWGNRYHLLSKREHCRIQAIKASFFLLNDSPQHCFIFRISTSCLEKLSRTYCPTSGG